MQVKIHKILKHTKAEGPSLRYCIWFQGCKKRCRGCWAHATWDFDGGVVYDTNDILEDILNTPKIEGVTFLGGEPFEQPNALKELAFGAYKNGLSVLCFTGYKIEELKEKYFDILQNIDILIDGEYKEEERDFSRPWVGSSNQRYHFLSKRYNSKILKKYKNKIEININKDGTLFINGMGDFESFAQKLGMPYFH